MPDDHERAIEEAAAELAPICYGNDALRLAEAIVQAYHRARAEGESPAKLCPREPTERMRKKCYLGPIISWKAAWDAAPEPGGE